MKKKIEAMSKAWGMPTWIFLHSLLAQMPNVLYTEETLTQLKALCSVLPCPTCAAHATAFLSTISFQNVPTLEACRLMLWQFHNIVNARRGVAPFPWSEMVIFQRTNLAVLYRVFLAEFTRPRQIPKLFIDSMNRRRVMQQFQAWMKRMVNL